MVNLVVYNIAKTFNWICLIAYLFIIVFWIYQFLKKEQMVRLLKQLDAIIANKGIQNVTSRLSKNISFISVYGWFEFAAMIAAIVIGFTLRFKNGLLRILLMHHTKKVNGPECAVKWLVLLAMQLVEDVVQLLVRLFMDL